MTGEAYRLELQRRGFVYDAQRSEWHGPFGLKVTGALNTDGNDLWSRRVLDHAVARVDQLRQVDERLRARRGLTRAPLVPPVPYPNPVTYKPIPPPHA